MTVRLPICLDCAAKLRALRAELGEAAMAKAMARTLCGACSARVRELQGIPPGAPLCFELRQRD